MNLIKGMHHAALRCCGKAEMDAVITFYCNVLGMKRLRSWGKDTEAGAMLDTGSGVIELFANAEPGRKPGQVDHIALATDKVDDCMAAAAKANYNRIRKTKNFRLDREKCIGCGLCARQCPPRCHCHAGRKAKVGQGKMYPVSRMLPSLSGGD